MGHPLWPLFDLRINTPRLELRLPTDDDLVEQMDVIRDGVHTPDLLPFNTNWVDRPSPERERGYVQHHWGQRATWTPDDWNLVLSVFVDGQVIGSQSIAARNFKRVRGVNTGSWLGLAYQSQGYGTEMRAAVLELAFTALGAVEAHSTARVGNHASLRVSKKLGYEDNGSLRLIMSDEVAEQQILRLTRKRWKQHRPEIDISISGLEDCADLFGIS